MFEYSNYHLDFEMYFPFYNQTAMCLLLSVVAVLVIVFIFTTDLTITLLVAFSVCVTDFFLLGLVWYWGLTLNQIVVLNIIIAIGTSVDYSTHIAYAYLVTGIPEGSKEYDTPQKIRSYKAQMALRTMGPSVFHGGFSTFIAIIVLSPSKTYIFLVFFRLWFGIILFGMANGFMLLPVILTFVGPTYTVKSAPASEDDKDCKDKAKHEDCYAKPETDA